MMSLFEELVDKEGVKHKFAGILPGRAIMQQRVAALGTQKVDFSDVLGGEKGEQVVMGHTYHFSKSETTEPTLRAVALDGREGEAVYVRKRLVASYIHLYFSSAPTVVAKLFA